MLVSEEYGLKYYDGGIINSLSKEAAEEYINNGLNNDAVVVKRTIRIEVGNWEYV